MNLSPCRSWGAAALLFAVCSSEATELSATATSPISVAAIAADVRSVVLRAPDGALRRYSVGEQVQGLDWRIREVTASSVILQSDVRLHGQPLQTILQLGQSIDLAEISRQSELLQMPQMVPGREKVSPVVPARKPQR